MSTPMIIALGVLLPFIGTMGGIIMAICFHKSLTRKRLCLLNALAAGVMAAAAIWSLLLPAISMAEGIFRFFPAVSGFLLGCFVIHLLEKKFTAESDHTGSMLYLAVTLHNIPEGMAVGAGLSGLLCTGSVSLTAAVMLSIGIAIQNIPEGGIVYAPLVSGGMSKKKAFLLSVLSAVAELAGALLTLCFSTLMVSILPYMLSIAAGAMIFVVAEEMIPHSHNGSSCASFVFCLGFSVMMLLDVAFG